MQWALQRQLLYALGVLAVFTVFGVFFYFTYLYEPASCFDGVQNQDEEGVDCGGSCALLCVAPNVTVLWARAVPVAPGVYHAVGMVRNPDTGAGGSVSYEISLFDEENILITRRSGEFAIDPGEVAPLFEANVVTGERTPSRTFIELTPRQFTREERALSPVRVLNWDFDEEGLRLTASIENQGTRSVSDTRIIALLYNDAGTLVSASQTLSGPLTVGERKTVTFTWQGAFSEPIARVDILPNVIE